MQVSHTSFNYDFLYESHMEVAPCQHFLTSIHQRRLSQTRSYPLPPCQGVDLFLFFLSIFPVTLFSIFSFPLDEKSSVRTGHVFPSACNETEVVFRAWCLIDPSCLLPSRQSQNGVTHHLTCWPVFGTGNISGLLRRYKFTQLLLTPNFPFSLIWKPCLKDIERSRKQNMRYIPPVSFFFLVLANRSFEHVNAVRSISSEQCYW